MNEEKTTLVYYAKLNERNESVAIWEHYNYLNEIVKGKVVPVMKLFIMHI